MKIVISINDFNGNVQTSEEISELIKSILNENLLKDGILYNIDAVAETNEELIKILNKKIGIDIDKQNEIINQMEDK